LNQQTDNVQKQRIDNVLQQQIKPMLQKEKNLSSIPEQ
jgi:hypothetical protein